MILVVPITLVAAFVLSASDAMQRLAAHRTVGRRPAGVVPGNPWGRLLRLLRQLVRNRLWIAGWSINLAGFLIQALALHLGSVPVVQSLLVTQLLFALGLGWATGGPRPGVTAWFAALVVCGGLAVLLTVRGAVPGNGDALRGRLLLTLVAAGGAVVLLVAAGRGRSQVQRAALYGIGAGVCFAVSAMLVKLTTADLINRGIPATAVDWPGYALAGSTLLGLLVEQGAFATGSLPLATTTMTTTNIAVSYVIGVLGFAVRPPTTPGALAGACGGVALLVLGIAVLAHSHALADRPAPATDSEPDPTSDPAPEAWSALRPEDALFLHVDSPQAPQQVGAVVLLEPRGNGSLPQQEDVLELIRAMPGLHRVLRRPTGLHGAQARVEQDGVPADLVTVEEAAGRPLSLLVDEFVSTALELSQAPVAITLVRGLPDGRSALLIALHHALGDGIAVLRALVGQASGAPSPAAQVTRRQRPPLGRTVRGLAALARGGRAAQTGLDGPLSGARHLELVDIPTGAVRALARDAGVTSEDVLLAMVAEAIDRAGVAGTPRLRVMVPRTLRTRGSLESEGNHTGAARIDVDLTGASLLDRAGAIHAALLGQARSGGPAAAVTVIRLIGLLPPVLRGSAARAAYSSTWFNVIVSVLPGPRRPPTALGCSVSGVYPVLPLAPRLGLAVGVLRWGDQHRLTVAMDALRSEQAEQIAEQLRQLVAGQPHPAGPATGDAVPV